MKKLSFLCCLFFTFIAATQFFSCRKVVDEPKKIDDKALFYGSWMSYSEQTRYYENDVLVKDTSIVYGGSDSSLFIFESPNKFKSISKLNGEMLGSYTAIDNILTLTINNTGGQQPNPIKYAFKDGDLFITLTYTYFDDGKNHRDDYTTRMIKVK
jgi:hypothetical protein